MTTELADQDHNQDDQTFPEPEPQPPRRIHYVRRVIAGIASVVILSQILVLAAFVMPARFHNPTRTAFMKADPDGYINPWVDADNISRNMLVAIIAHEDEQFPLRTLPFNPKEFLDRATAYINSQPDPSGSTIDQQLAKNLWLWKSQDPFRKVLEADMSGVMTLSVPKWRRLELYANTSQFGTGLYGVCGASWYYFGIRPAKLSLDQSAQLVGLLPDPTRFSRAKKGGVAYHKGNGTIKDPGDIVAWARAHIVQQASWVGGIRATRSLGFLGTAEEHVGGVRCDVMPPAVRDKLISDKFIRAVPAPPVPAG